MNVDNIVEKCKADNVVAVITILPGGEYCTVFGTKELWLDMSTTEFYKVVGNHVDQAWGGNRWNSDLGVLDSRKRGLLTDPDKAAESIQGIKDLIYQFNLEIFQLTQKLVLLEESNGA